MRKHHNGLKTAFLFGSMWAILLAIGGLISAGSGKSIFIFLFAGIGLAMTAYSYWNSASLALASMDAVPVTPEQAPAMYRIVEELSAKAGQPMPGLYISPSMTPNAFATGRDPQHAAVCCTTGILQLLDERELRGVLAHELMHVYNRDILTSSVASGMAGVISSVAQFAMVFGGGNNREGGGMGVLGGLLMALVAPFASMLIQFAISRTREFDADEDGARLAADPLALASALKKLERGNDMAPMESNPENNRVAAMMIANPFRGGGFARMFSTHPPMDQRIARLEEMAGYRA